mmetsp:Transcript_9106/g.29329  ORF Transcript_9106/g.29329 Transcript_9106/m.29329 type:complete len:224 (+) Transcript_9106:3349-4020(+)
MSALSSSVTSAFPSPSFFSLFFLCLSRSSFLSAFACFSLAFFAFSMRLRSSSEMCTFISDNIAKDDFSPPFPDTFSLFSRIFAFIFSSKSFAFFSFSLVSSSVFFKTFPYSSSSTLANFLFDPSSTTSCADAIFCFFAFFSFLSSSSSTTSSSSPNDNNPTFAFCFFFFAFGCSFFSSDFSSGTATTISANGFHTTSVRTILGNGSPTGVSPSHSHSAIRWTL